MTKTHADDVLIKLGEGWAISPHIDALGDGMFRRVRPQLNVTAFGINVKVMEPDSVSKHHLHHQQQEVIFVHEGEIRVSFNDGSTHTVGAGGLVVIDAGLGHAVRVTSDDPAVLLMMGGKDGVVEGDAEMLEELPA
ncbi:MAG: Cupin 2 conserved barrel domain protein [Aeromicrobium sp.]|nr:Cupin 2 conserved barrel domain protein [Aeromicrobium sp.]